MLLIAVVGAPAANANPTNYIFDFTGSPPFPTAASFTYDSSTQTFSSFLVTWDNYTFDLTGSANAPIVTGAPCGTLTGGAASFALLSGACALDTVDWFAHVSPTPEFGLTTFDANGNLILVWANSSPVTYPYYVAGGTWTIDDNPDTDDPDNAPVPEPSSASLIASALVSGASVARKRIAQRFRLDS